MKNLHEAHWTQDPYQREEFLTKVGPRIDRESKYMAHCYGVGIYQEDIASQIRSELLEQMDERDTDGPFAKDTPQEAIALFLAKDNYRIRERARTLVRSISGKRSRQAEILADVRQPDLGPDIQTQLLTIFETFPRIVSKIPDLTARDFDILCKETFRQVGADDLSAEVLEQALQPTGISGTEILAYCEYYDQHGHLSPSDRKAWSRARPKLKDFRDKFKWLLVIGFALSLGLHAIHQSRSNRQNDFVNHGSRIHQNALAHQGNLIHHSELAHQSNLIHQNDLAHQDGLIHQNGLAHQGNLIPERAFAHQGNLIQQNALAHQGGLVTTDYDPRG